MLSRLGEESDCWIPSVESIGVQVVAVLDEFPGGGGGGGDDVCGPVEIYG